MTIKLGDMKTELIVRDLLLPGTILGREDGATSCFLPVMLNWWSNEWVFGTVFMQHYYFVFETHFVTKNTKMTIGERATQADVTLFPRQVTEPDYFLEAMLIICLAAIGGGIYIFCWVKKK